MPVDVNTQVSSSITSLEQEFNAIAHNLANVDTVGYKRITTSFSKALESQRGISSGDDTARAQVNMQIDFSQGLSLQETGRTLDVALCGEGFFVVESPEGPLYTRNGSFRLNQNGQMVDSAGRIVSGEGGPVTIGSDIAVSQINISSGGEVSAAGQGLGKLRIVYFPESKDKIVPVGQSCFKAPEDAEPTVAENVVCRQGYLESSNVKIVDELVSMIMVSRLYEANMKSLSAKREASSSLMGVAMG